MLAILLAAVLATLPDSVSVSQYGTHYHRGTTDCPTCVRVLRIEAEDAGYTRCLRCFPTKPRKARPWDQLPKGGQK